MPVMDGIALALAAARDGPELVILLMPGFADQRERASGLDALVQGVLAKPFSVADLEAASAPAWRPGGLQHDPEKLQTFRTRSCVKTELKS